MSREAWVTVVRSQLVVLDLEEMVGVLGHEPTHVEIEEWARGAVPRDIGMVLEVEIGTVERPKPEPKLRRGRGSY